MDQGATTTGLAGEVRVWDVGVRAFHWLLAGAVLGAAYTGAFEKRLALRVHLVLGVSVVLLLGFRLVWGFFGGTYARFGNFFPRRQALLDHVRGLRDPQPERHLGHNPLGALMVFGLICMLAVIAATGAGALGGMLKQGPFASFLSYTGGHWLLRAHAALALILVAMVLAHLGGVVFESRRHGENLARAMVTGRKRVYPPAESAPPAQARPLAASAILVVGFLVGAAGVEHLAARPGFGVPPTKLDKTYSADCSGCHMA